MVRALVAEPARASDGQVGLGKHRVRVLAQRRVGGAQRAEVVKKHLTPSATGRRRAITSAGHGYPRYTRERGGDARAGVRV